MNILAVTFDYPPEPLWGMGWNVFDLKKGLEINGNKVIIATVNRYGKINNDLEDIIFCDCNRIAENLKRGGCVCNTNDETCLDQLYQKVKIKLEKEKFVPDIIHCHGWMVYGVALKLSIEYKIPIVSTIHFLEFQFNSIENHPFIEQLKWILEKEQEMIYGSNLLICVSNYGFELISKIYPESKSKACVILHGIDTPNDLLPTIRLQTKKKVITFVGRIEEEKGIETLCEVVAQDQIINNVELNIIGSGSLINKLKRKYGGIYNFYGYVDRNCVRQVLFESDFIAIPSVEEQFGLVALEAMASGAVPIASNVGGLKEIIQNKKNGFLFDLEISNNRPGIDKQLLKEIIVDAINISESELNSIRSRNFEMVRKNYSLEVMAKNTIRMYKKALIK